MDKKKIIRIAILVVCIVAFLVSSAFVVKYFVEKNNNKQMYEDLANQTTEPDVTEEVKKPDYSAIVEQNSDTVGWITIPGTNINHPVLQRLNNDYYMNHNFEGEYEYRGAIFMDWRNDPSALDGNTIIYGHNAYDGTVFSDIANYDDIEYFKKHPVIEFNTLDTYYKWKICAVFITNQTKTDDNGYIFNYVYPHNMDDENFDVYTSELEKRTLYHTGVDIQKGDKVLTLSSCARNLDMKNYRAKISIVVVARMVREGEEETVDVSKAYVNENPKYPQLYYKKYGIENPFKDDEKWYPVKGEEKWNKKLEVSN